MQNQRWWGLVPSQSLGCSAGKTAFISLGHLFEIVSLVTFSPSETWQFSLHWSARSCLSLLGHQDTARPSGQGFYYYLFSQAPGHWTYHLFNSNHKKPLKVILVNGLVTFVILTWNLELHSSWLCWSRNWGGGAQPFGLSWRITVHATTLVCQSCSVLSAKMNWVTTDGITEQKNAHCQRDPGELDYNFILLIQEHWIFILPSIHLTST